MGADAAAFDPVLFDLDGTLTDPGPGITRSIGHSLETYGRPVPPDSELRACIGPPLQESFRRFLGADADDAAVERHIEAYRDRYREIGIYECEVIPEIEGVLAELAESGLTLRVVTSKPTVFAREVVEHFGLARWFAGIHGSELDGTRADKQALLAHVVACESLDAKRCAMIGDRHHDVVGAITNGITPVGVLWGYGDREEREAAGAARVARYPLELLDFLSAPATV